MAAGTFPESVTVTVVSVPAGEGRCEVLVGSDLLRELGAIIAKTVRARRCALVSDSTIAARFGEGVEAALRDAGFDPTPITVPPGEKSKSLNEAGRICEQMISAGLDRSSFVVGLGGGVVCDLAGFVASIYHRGIPHLLIPTTLLAQVDGAIGGKTAVNSASGKNLLGAIHHPVLVIADVDTLKTLPPREFKQGFAEIIKHAIIRDAAIFDTLEKLDRDDLAPLIRRNIEIKAEFVAMDERDITGERALLNFGHTVGHAIERAGDYNQFLHGEAISLGIVAACGISARKAGLPEAERERVIAALQMFDLPTRLPANFPRHKVLEAIPFDKKFEGGQVRFLVTPGLGSAHLATDVTMEDIRAAVDEL